MMFDFGVGLLVPERFLTIGRRGLLVGLRFYVGKDAFDLSFWRLKGRVGRTFLLVFFKVLFFSRSERREGLVVGNGSVLQNYWTVRGQRVLGLSTFIFLSIREGRLKRRGILVFEYGLLVGFIRRGLFIRVEANDFLLFYLSFERQSLGLYVLASFQRDSAFSTEAGLKYFIMGAVGTGMILLGLVLLYSATGSFVFREVEMCGLGGGDPVFWLGSFRVLSSVLFKIGAFPFQMWVPDVYEGAPLVTGMFFARVPKAGMFYRRVHLLWGPFMGILPSLLPLLIIVGMGSIYWGVLGGRVQRRVKRLLGYSSIGHVGFLLLGLSEGGLVGIEASSFYLWLYLRMSFLVWGRVLRLADIEKKGVGGGFRSEWSGLGKERMVVGSLRCTGVLSIGGVPPLVGFFSKLRVVRARGFVNKILVAVLVLRRSGGSMFYYLRFVKLIFFDGGSDGRLKVQKEVDWGIGFWVISLVRLVVLLRVGPTNEPRYLLVKRGAGSLSG